MNEFSSTFVMKRASGDFFFPRFSPIRGSRHGSSSESIHSYCSEAGAVGNPQGFLRNKNGGGLVLILKLTVVIFEVTSETRVSLRFPMNERQLWFLSIIQEYYCLVMKSGILLYKNPTPNLKYLTVGAVRHHALPIPYRKRAVTGQPVERSMPLSRVTQRS